MPRLLLVPLLLILAAGLAACDTNGDAGCDGGDLQVEELAEGLGAVAAATDTVTVAYTGRLEDGTLFGNRPPSNPDTVALGGTSAPVGFRQGVTGMRVGGRRRLTIPPRLAYGEEGLPGAIPPCATLSFDVELLGIE